MEDVTFRVEFTDEEAMGALRLPMDLLDEMGGMIARTRELAKPKAAFKKLDIKVVDERNVLLDEVRTESRVMAVNMANCAFAVGYVCTCGRELDDAARAEPDPMDGFLQDALNEMVLLKALAQLRALAAEKFAMPKLHVMAPGSLADWPLPRQADLFSAIGDVTGTIGVSLTESFLMVPVKSVSGVFFSKEEDFVNCALCPMENCPNRKAAYDQSLLEGSFTGAKTRFDC